MFKYKILGLLVVVLVILESLLRVSQGPLYCINRPNMERRLNPSSEFIPGIYGDSTLTTNSTGLRGSDPAGESLKILTVGGSTTACLYLDDKEAWPYLLQEKLKGHYGEDAAWVGNAGKSGCTTEHYAEHIRYIVPQAKGIRYIISLCGVNDLHVWLRNSKDYRNRLENAYGIFHYYPVSFYGNMKRASKLDIYHSTIIAQRLRSLYHRSKSIIQDYTGKWLIALRKKRSEAIKINIGHKFRTIDEALKSYKEKLAGMVEAAEYNNTKLILVTHPAMWRSDLSTQERKLLWWGSIDTGKNKDICFASPKEMQKTLILFNRAMINFCRANEVAYIDLAGESRDHRDIFYDDCHFNEKGARIAADILYAHMREIIDADQKKIYLIDI